MEFKINNSPELSMAEITKKLFNCKFLSDVQFSVAEQTIYCHSLELMKRSVVFQKQLEKTLGANKLIPINDVPYDSAYQFFRFIYTDDCHVNNTNVIGMLKLAKRYKVIKLENHVVELIGGMNIWLSIYEYCLLENDQHHIRRTQEAINMNLKQAVSSKDLVTVHPVVMEEILKFDRANLPEIVFFTALARWITQHAIDNQINMSQQSTHYSKYLHMVRFPAMTSDEIINCITGYSHLFNDNDWASILLAKSQKSKTEPPLWNIKPRGPLRYSCSFHTYSNGGNFKTKFSVYREFVLASIRIGKEYSNTNFEIIFSQTNPTTTGANSLKLEVQPTKNWNSIMVNLGESIRLQPKIEYTIRSNFKMQWPTQIYVRENSTDVFTNLPPHLIQFKNTGRNMIEMYFTLVRK